MNIRKTKHIIWMSLLALGVGLIVATTQTESIQYYLTVDELLEKADLVRGKEVKMAGRVGEGSIVRQTAANTIVFSVVQSGRSVDVAYRGIVPDTFKEGAEVVVTGTLAKDGTFAASHVLAKCASRYQEKLAPVSPPSSP
jgi:cytochrome c-type biogenesis protein CcmE